ncbi:MAG: sulfide/dihydroorotate dehydrogenase-like FAD/NAD-binding protein [Candidatus Schekmanbacteria bacterium]|nr:sulfide/dihydroorotate dehydrogenase-like FAD/NAD-binding protein [Candidatus Schekmanbacteria bacterium]
MARIKVKKTLAPGVRQFVVDAPLIARKAKAGQFVILRVCGEGERIPLTIADSDAATGELTIVFAEVGETTTKLGKLNAGEEILDLVGPLGKPTHLEKFGTVVCIAGGIGAAPVHPIVKALRKAGNEVITIMGSRNKDLMIFEEELRKVSSEVIITTDDGSSGRQGLVTEVLWELIEQGKKIDLVVAIGPVVMMQAVCHVTRDRCLPTVVSLNPIMVDGTGMCGACRVTVGGVTKFVCVDGPEFDGLKVDFDELKMRQRMYLAEEKRAFEEYKITCGGRC